MNEPNPFKGKLVDGRIPAHTVCPFRDECGAAKNNTCGHKGEAHTTAYSCGAARWFNMEEQCRERHAQRSQT